MENNKNQNFDRFTASSQFIFINSGIFCLSSVVVVRVSFFFHLYIFSFLVGQRKAGHWDNDVVSHTINSS